MAWFSAKCSKCSIECKPKRCARCKLSGYCGKICQSEDWPKHSIICRKNSMEIICEAVDDIERIKANHFALGIISGIVQKCAVKNTSLFIEFKKNISDKQYICDLDGQLHEDLNSLVCVNLFMYKSADPCTIMKASGNGFLTMPFDGLINPIDHNIIDKFFKEEFICLIISEDYCGMIISELQ